VAIQRFAVAPGLAAHLPWVATGLPALAMTDVWVALAMTGARRLRLRCVSADMPSRCAMDGLSTIRACLDPIGVTHATFNSLAGSSRGRA
jgi:hypothetical protein